MEKYHQRLQKEKEEREEKKLLRLRLKKKRKNSFVFKVKSKLKRLKKEIGSGNMRKLTVSAVLAFAMVVPYTGYAIHKLISVDAATNAVVTKAESRIGSRYVYGACHNYAQLRNRNQRAFDCSGLVNWSYYQSGNNIGLNTSSSLRRRGRTVSFRNLRAGDVVLFPHHAGVYIGNGRMVHAPNRRSRVKVTSLNGYWRRRFRSGRRIINRGFIQNRNRRTLRSTYKKPSAVRNRYRKYTTGTYRVNLAMNVRKGPSKGYRVTGYLRKGSSVKVYRIANGHWGKIYHHGRVRYVSLRYAQKIK